MSTSTIFSMGRICYKTKGRDAGQKVVVVGTAKDGFVTIEGIHTKKGRSNVSHLLPTKQVVKLASGYSKEDIKNALQGKKE